MAHRRFDRQELVTLNMHGIPDAEIARQIGCSPMTIFEWRKELGLPLRYRCRACSIVFEGKTHQTHCGKCGLRRCNVCGENKIDADFSFSRKNGGFRPTCRSCEAHAKRQGRFGLSPSDRTNLYAAQDGLCWLCRSPMTLEESRVDHDHSCSVCSGTGCSECIRGLAHHLCNTGVGFFGESPEKLRAAADAIELWRAGRGRRGISTPTHPSLS